MKLPGDVVARRVVRPHPVLPRYYGSEEQRRPFIKRIFDDAAAHYDRLESLMSLGSGQWYRGRALRRAGLAAGMNVLDVAVGTGLVARQAVKIVGASGSVTGVDPSAGMLAAAKGLPIRLVRGRAEELPFAANTFDFLCMGYALRHMSDLTAAMGQFISVLRPGGIVLILELTAPRRGVGRSLMGKYLRKLVPMASGAKAGKLLMDYYWETVSQCIEPAKVVEVMESVGLEKARWWAELGVFSEYTAVKPG